VVKKEEDVLRNYINSLTSWLVCEKWLIFVAENLLKDSFVVMAEQGEQRYSWLDHNHSTSVKFADADDFEYEVQGATVIIYCCGSFLLHLIL